MKNNILKIILVSLTIFSTFFTFGTTTYASSSSYFI